MKYSVIIYPIAQKDLQEIKLYWETSLNTSFNSFLDDFLAKIEPLKETPYLYQQPNDPVLRNKGYRYFSVGSYLAFYKVNEQEVQIHRVIYGKRSYLEII